MQESKSQARLAAEMIIGQFWLSQVNEIAGRALDKHERSSVTMYPPTEAQYAQATTILEVLLTPPTSEYALAVGPDPDPASSQESR